MKHLILILIGLFSIQTFAQMKSGFDKKEAMDMIQLCNSYSYIDLFNSDEDMIPKGYHRTYTSGVFGMDNKFQVYKTDYKYAVINFRGSTDKKISWMENFYSSMIPSEGVIRIQNEKFNYKFANDTAAHVHGGYALGIGYLHNDILFHINNINAQGIYDIILTGHSQGGALTQLILSYLENLPKGVISSKNKFKVYSFAAPMVGNQVFVDEYNKKFCETNKSFLILNPADMVPKLPLKYNDGGLLSAEQITAVLNREQGFNVKEVLYNGFMNLFENKITSLSHWLNTRVGGQIEDDLGDIEMPPFTSDINYSRVGNMITLEPVQYPIHLKDSTVLDNKEFMRAHPKGKDGYFEDKSLYETGKTFYQHKPYNYYIGMLEKYDPKKYKRTNPKYLKENL